MAIYILPIASPRITGSRRGSTFQRTANGFVIRKRSVIVQKRTAKQSVAKNRMDSIQKRWKSLTLAQKNVWIAEALDYPRQDSLGNIFNFSGANMQMGSNVNRAIAQTTPLNQPANGNTDAAPVLLPITVQINPPLVLIPKQPNQVNNQFALKVYATGAMSPGTFTPSLAQMKLVKVWLPGTNSLGDISAEYFAIYPLTSIHVGQLVFGAISQIRLATGQESLLSLIRGAIIT